jgi:hypothetical protein
MALESATKIDELNPSNPASTDAVGKGDDHIRMIKAAVQGSFPNFGAATDTGIVTLDADTINALPADDAQQDADRALVVTELLNHVVPIGVINLWSGSIATIPSGWKLCDGGTGTNNLGDPYTTPDLRNTFVMAAGGTYNPGDTGGATTDVSTAAGAHDHGGSVSAEALSVAQLPAHRHLLFNTDNLSENVGGFAVAPTANEQVPVLNDTGGGGGYGMAGSGTEASIGRSSSVGSGATHTHTVTAELDHTHTVDIIPPFYALAYIMKVDGYDDPLAP